MRLLEPVLVGLRQDFGKCITNDLGVAFSLSRHGEGYQLEQRVTQWEHVNKSTKLQESSPIFEGRVQTSAARPCGNPSPI